MDLNTSNNTNDSTDAFFSDLRFSSIINNLSHSVMILDRSGNILYANKTAIAGFLQVIVNPLIVGDNILDVIHSSEKENFALNVEKVFQGKDLTMLLRFLRRDREENWFRFSMSPFRNEKNNIIGISLEIKDINTSKIEESYLQPNENRYKEIIEEQTELICRYYPDGVISFVNASYCNYFGKEENDLIGENFFDLIPTEGKVKAIAKLKELSSELPLYNYDLQVIDTNNSVRWLTCTGRGIFDRRGMLKEIQMVGRDITERKQLVTELHQSNQKLEAMLKVIPDVMFLFDVHANIIDCYASNPSQLYMPREAFIGKNIQDVFPHHVIDTMSEKINMCFETKELQIQEYKVEIRARKVRFECRYVNVGENAVLSIARDITERKNIEDELIRAKEKAEESDRLKTSFLANISHEIRTPMNAIIGFSRILLEPGLKSEQIKEYSSIISSSSNQLLTIIEDVINISKIESGQFSVKNEKTELAAVLKHVKMLHENIAVLHNLKLRSYPDPAFEELFLMTDENKLKQILSNLVGNAIKYSENSTVDFGFFVKRDVIEFFVKDYGIGIPPEYHEIIFERFRQAETEAQKRYSGAGLGLSIAKSLVESLGGRIWLESQTGHGTQFYFTIPANNIELSEESLRNSPGSITKNGWIGRKILVVEDEDTNYQLICDLLKTSGMSIARARNGVEALSLVHSNEPDLVLMDIKMPVMNGLAATKAIRKHHRHIPIVALITYPFTQDKAKALKAGCNDYLTKPVDSNDLLLILQKYLEHDPGKRV